MCSTSFWHLLWHFEAFDGHCFRETNPLFWHLLWHVLFWVCKKWSNLFWSVYLMECVEVIKCSSLTSRWNEMLVGCFAISCLIAMSCLVASWDKLIRLCCMRTCQHLLCLTSYAIVWLTQVDLTTFLTIQLIVFNLIIGFKRAFKTSFAVSHVQVTWTCVAILTRAVLKELWFSY